MNETLQLFIIAVLIVICFLPVLCFLAGLVICLWFEVKEDSRGKARHLKR
jgi:hypothetical protein